MSLTGSVCHDLFRSPELDFAGFSGDVDLVKPVIPTTTTTTAAASTPTTATGTLSASRLDYGTTNGNRSSSSGMSVSSLEPETAVPPIIQLSPLSLSSGDDDDDDDDDDDLVAKHDDVGQEPTGSGVTSSGCDDGLPLMGSEQHAQNHRPLARAQTDPTCYLSSEGKASCSSVQQLLATAPISQSMSVVSTAAQHGPALSTEGSRSASAAASLKPPLVAVRSSPLESVRERPADGSDATDGVAVSPSSRSNRRVVVRTGSRGTSIRDRLSRTLSLFSQTDLRNGSSTDSLSRSNSASTANAVPSPSKSESKKPLVHRLSRSLSMGSRPKPKLGKRKSRGDTTGSSSPADMTLRRLGSTSSEQTSPPLSPFGVPETYQRLCIIGEGSYATVYKGFSSRLNGIVAMKEIALNPEEGAPFTAIREASLLKGLKHANIVILHDIIHTRTRLTFVFEYLDTDLSRYMDHHKTGLATDEIRLFLYQILRGLVYIHARRILHRDVKPQNMLISKNGELKLADFGLARAKSVPSHTFTHEVVTVWYRPPDVLLGSTTYDSSIDMWGLGCVFLEMFQSIAVFAGLNDTHDQLISIFRVLGTPSEETWPGISKLEKYDRSVYGRFCRLQLAAHYPRLAQSPGAEHLADRLLRMNPKERLSSSEAINHPYFASLPSAVARLPCSQSIFSTGQVKFSGGDCPIFATDPLQGMVEGAQKASAADAS